VTGDVLSFVICVLATYRLSTMATVEHGPFALCARARRVTGAWRARRLLARGDFEARAAGGARLTDDPDWILAGLTCPVCASWWIAMPCAVAWVLAGGHGWGAFLAAWPAMSGAAALLWRMTEGRS
jgi:hypothetical protein